MLEANRNYLAQMRELSVKISQVKRDIDDWYSQYAKLCLGGIVAN